MGRKKSRGRSTIDSRVNKSKCDRIDRNERKKAKDANEKVIADREVEEEEEKKKEKEEEKESKEDNNDNESRKKEISYEEADASIRIRFRLSYPFVDACLPENSPISSDESDDGEEEDRVELDIRPRFVFVSSLCAVCLERSRIFCERCRMVSYCSTTHRAQKSLEHRDTCNALKEIYSTISRSLSDESNRSGIDAEQYRAYRLWLLGSLEVKVGRPLKLWEKEIVLYPRICRICRRFRESLICCACCAMEYFCEDHGKEHEKWCEEFQVLRRCLFLQYRHGRANPRIPNVRREILVASPDIDFDRLMHGIYRNSSYYREMDCHTYSTLSHLCTVPLTALYSMQICCPEWRSETEWTVHVLGAEFQFEGANLHVWEKLFLHFLPNLKRLRLMLVGPELRLPSGVSAKLLSKIKLCSDCKAAGKSIRVRFRVEKLYHEFTREQSEEVIVEPNLICLFNPGLYRKTGFAGKDTWLETIREFSKISVPIVITSYTADEITWDVTRVMSASDVEVLLEPRRNPFASIKPDRNFVSDDINPLIYKNYYIAIVKGRSTLS